MSPRTVLQTHRILKKGLNQAMRWNLIGRNPVNLVDPPSFEAKEMLALDTHQLAMHLKHAEGSKFGPVFHLAAFTGLRRGELAGLKWQDVDLENRLISVRREIIFVPGKGHLTTQPKSQSSRRTVDITDMTASVMRRHRSKQAQHRMYLGSVWKDEGWVFTNPDGGHVNPNALSKAFKVVREELGLPPVRLHDLRHTHASILLKQGIHLKVIQERLGHSTIAMTGDIYSHVVPGLQKAAAHSFEDAMGEVVQTAS